jgi:hypothetical protein
MFSDFIMQVIILKLLYYCCCFLSYLFIGALKPNNKMDSDVYLAEFLVYDALELTPNAELKKVNLSHMQRNKDAIASDDILATIVKCVSQCQSYIVINGKFPRFRNSITPTPPPQKNSKIKKSTTLPLQDSLTKDKM